MTADENKKDDYQEKIKKLAEVIKSNFGEDKKFCYIIGDNGTGKSSVLADIAVLYAEEEVEVKVKKDGDDEEKAAEKKNVFCIANTIYDRFFSIGSNKNITYLGARNVSNAIFYSSIDRGLINILLETRIKTIEDIIGFNFYLKIDGIDKDDPPIDKRKIKNRSLEDKKPSWDIVKKIDSNFPLDNFDPLLDKDGDGKKTEEELKKLEESKNALKRLLGLNLSVTLKISKKDEKEIFSFDEMSSGEQIRIAFFAKIMGNIKDNCIFVIDEPEISAHLHWQKEFHALLEKAINGSGKTGVRAIIATHSPTLISEAAHNPDVLALTLRENEKGEIIHETLALEDKQSFDRVVLNGFDTIPYNSSALEEQMVEIIASIDVNSINKSDLEKKEENEIRKIRKKY